MGFYAEFIDPEGNVMGLWKNQNNFDLYNSDPFPIFFIYP